ncbi:MAG: deiodinase [Myxococcales bacterium]|nr:deiodinase [Myxococcales bacterium]
MYREFSNQVEFFVVYIKEIHPTDGWQVKENEQDAILFRTHESLAERVAVGRSCMIKLALEMPALVDEMDDAVATIYGAMPERLYLISRDGNVAYKSGVGPMFFKPREWQEAIRSYLAEER